MSEINVNQNEVSNESKKIKFIDFLKYKYLSEQGEDLSKHGYGHILGTKDEQYINNVDFKLFMKRLDEDYNNIYIKNQKELQKKGKIKAQNSGYYCDSVSGFDFFDSWRKLYCAYWFFGVESIIQIIGAAQEIEKLYPESNYLNKGSKTLHLAKLKIEHKKTNKMRIEANKWITEGDYLTVLKDRFAIVADVWLSEEDALKAKCLNKVAIQEQKHMRKLRRELKISLSKMQGHLTSGDLVLMDNKENKEQDKEKGKKPYKNNLVSECNTIQNSSYVKGDSVCYFKNFTYMIRDIVPTLPSSSGFGGEPYKGLVNKIFNEIVDMVSEQQDKYGWRHNHIVTCYSNAENLGITETLWKVTEENTMDIAKKFSNEPWFKNNVNNKKVSLSQMMKKKLVNF